MLSRRTFLYSLPAVSLASLPTEAAYRLTRADEDFLDDLCRRALRYFTEQSDPQTGLTLDRARTDGTTHDETHRNTASIASTGFGLTALCIAAERGWMRRDAAAWKKLGTP